MTPSGDMADDGGLTHLAGDGAPRMVPVGEKPPTRRTAVAEGLLRCNAELLRRIRQDDLAKGSVFQVAQLAGIQAAKRTDELIPLCHAIPLDEVAVRLELVDGGVRVRASASATWRTGVEMEALVAASVALLTVIDMGKAIDRAMTIERIALVEKRGGRGGDWTRDDPAEPAP